MRMILYNDENPVLILNLFRRYRDEHLITPSNHRYGKIFDWQQKITIVTDNMNKSDADHIILSIWTQVTILTINPALSTEIRKTALHWTGFIRRYTSGSLFFTQTQKTPVNTAELIAERLITLLNCYRIVDFFFCPEICFIWSQKYFAFAHA